MSLAWFMVLIVLTVLAVSLRPRPIRWIVVLLIIGTVWYRESALYIFLRVAFDARKARGALTSDFATGMRAMYDHVHASSIYAIGSAALLGVLALLGPAGTRRPKAGGESHKEREEPKID